MKKNFSFFNLLSFLLLIGYIPTFGKAKLIQGETVTSYLLEQNKDFSGFRIQVFSGKATEREKAESIKSEIENRFKANVYISYTANTFRVQVGDFISKLDAIPLKHRLKRKYRNCYIVKVAQIQLFPELEIPRAIDNNDMEVLENPSL